MDADPQVADAARPPGARDLLPLLPIVLLVAWTVRWFEREPWVSTRTAVLIAVASGGLIGLPVIFWMLDHGRRRLAAFTAIGAAAGLIPLGLIVVAAVMGLLVRIGPEGTGEMLARGAPMPGMGLMAWPTFGRAELSAMLTGALSGAIYWALMIARRRVNPHRLEG
jgi:hypothetical protein